MSTAAALTTSFCGLDLASPIVLLSGCVGFGEEYTRIEGFSNRDAGAIVLKGTTRAARLGNAPHRVCETSDGMRLRLEDGGSKLLLDGVAQDDDGPGEYPDIYRTFGDLIDNLDVPVTSAGARVAMRWRV